jgi:hypothetical protein
VLKSFCYTVILFILIPAHAFAQTTYYPGKKHLSVKSEGRLLSEILTEVSAKTGIDFYINPDVDKKIFINIESQPLEKAIKRMIKPLNNAIIFQGDTIVAVKIFVNSYAESTLKIVSATAHGDFGSQPTVQGDDDNAGESEGFEKEEPIHTPPHLMKNHDEDFQTMEKPEGADAEKERRIARPPHLIRQDLHEGLLTKEEFEKEMKGTIPPAQPHLMENHEEDFQTMEGPEGAGAEKKGRIARPPHLIRQDLHEGLLKKEEFEKEMQIHTPPHHMENHEEDAEEM